MKKYYITDKTSNTGKDLINESLQNVENYEDAIVFETREEAQKFITENELDVLKDYQLQWAGIMEVETEEELTD